MKLKDIRRELDVVIQKQKRGVMSRFHQCMYYGPGICQAEKRRCSKCPW